MKSTKLIIFLKNIQTLNDYYFETEEVFLLLRTLLKLCLAHFSLEVEDKWKLSREKHALYNEL